jgi:hypothetical protein
LLQKKVEDFGVEASWVVRTDYRIIGEGKTSNIFIESTLADGGNQY